MQVFQLAKQKGFSSNIDDYNRTPDLLKLTEIHQWLMNEKKLFVQVGLSDPKRFDVLVLFIETEEIAEEVHQDFNNYMAALNAGVFTALSTLP